ncbi:MAG: methyltransferase domain-containing protein [Paracoccaceae bacterium]
MTTFDYHVAIWVGPIGKSAELIRQKVNRGAAKPVLVDVGGMNGRLSKAFVGFDYSVVDIQPDPECAAVKYVVGSAECLPVESETTDIVLTCSAIQYFDQERFFSEAKRVLKSGGYLVVHENGCCNPVIFVCRCVQRIIGLFNSDQWRYRNTIIKYYRPRQIEGFVVTYADTSCFLSPLSFVSEMVFGRSLATGFLTAVDDYLLAALPIVKKLSWFNVVHYKKL